MKKVIVRARIIRGEACRTRQARADGSGRRATAPARFGLVCGTLLLLFFFPSPPISFRRGSSCRRFASPEQIHRLIEALGDADYFVRQKAESDLGKIGFDAVEALTAASDTTTWKSPRGPIGCCARSAATGPSRANLPSFRNCWRITNRRTTAAARPGSPD